MKSLLILLIITCPFCAIAQKKVVLVNDEIAKIQYVVKNKQVVFYMESFGSPRVEVDVNGNGRLDKMLDRSYGKTNDWKLCAQYLLEDGASTVCGGAPSKASMDVKKDDIIYTIPITELSVERKPANIKLSFVISVEKNGSWTYYRYPEQRGFENAYSIRLH